LQQEDGCGKWPVGRRFATIHRLKLFVRHF
jgi:hypothetical protein